jgi:hypothetical protein
VFADNVLPSILIHLGVIDLSTAVPALANLFPSAGDGDRAAVANCPAHITPTPSAGTTTALLLAAAPESAAPSARTSKVSTAVPVEGPTPTPAQAYILRAAAIEACERIVAHAHAMSAAGRGASWLKDVTLPNLDIWLWTVAKDRADYRALPRFALRNTPFF